MNSYCDSDYNNGSTTFASAVEPKIVEGSDIPPIGPDDEGKILGVQNGVAEWVSGGVGFGNVSSTEISIIKVLDREEYDALEIKDPRTLYMIRG